MNDADTGLTQSYTTSYCGAIRTVLNRVFAFDRSCASFRTNALSQMELLQSLEPHCARRAFLAG